MTLGGWDDPVAGDLYAALEAAGVDATAFGTFGRLVAQTVDYNRAAPVLVDWLPRVSDPALKDAVVRSLAGQSGRHRFGAAALIHEFTDPRHSPSLRWSVGNALASVAGPNDGPGIRALLADARWGEGRQMLCDAIVRTKDPAGVNVLLTLVGDDTIAGHAISALRRTNTGKSALASPSGREKLIAVLGRETATIYARRQASAALAGRSRDICQR
jgi:hypothetical protein